MERIRSLSPDLSSHCGERDSFGRKKAKQGASSPLLQVAGVSKSLSSENIPGLVSDSSQKLSEYSATQFSPVSPGTLAYTKRYDPKNTSGLSVASAITHSPSCSDVSSEHGSENGVVATSTSLVVPSITITSPGNESPAENLTGLAGTMRRGSLNQAKLMDPDQQLSEFLSCRSSLRRTSLPPPLLNREKSKKEATISGTFPKICGLENILKDPRQGIPKEHLEGVSEAARWNLCVTSIRPVARVATTPILANERSKGLDFKEKTSEWGPHAAYPPLDQGLSKLFDAPSDVIRKYQESADKKSHMASQLSLTLERINELKGMPLPKTDIPLLENVRWFENGNCSFTARPAAGCKPYFFMGISNPDGTFDIKILTSAGYKPMMIFKVIADYDLGFIYTPMSRIDLSGVDKPAVPQISPKTIRERIAVYEAHMQKRRGSSPVGQLAEDIQRLQTSVASMDVFLKPMDKKLGNLTQRHQRILRYFNSAVGRSDKKNPMFHHGPDNLNPASDPASNYPLTVIIPFDVGVLKDHYYMIENDEELTFVLQVLKNHGYHAPVNPEWTVGKVVKAEFSTIKELTHSEWVGPLMETKKSKRKSGHLDLL
ncbi:CyaA/EF/ExoY family adenylyl cyclase toxin [Sansalvadorimonas sp. 2012CJ34-2]|uniref:CyaA/EF/ExoY family adenylyl cyclase toxin n=1 Tax=Parendozoicomonas callyspongiae TaxID=2942213 RepID=A0ABT0PFF3_9GAMM|nr:CyaA/EF/ExoY family adenylyl cyclase toxin [Sansalvadorimonas sp. 2012CJ34-2]MCL6269263.1 CyaA/EF/ExoY family adenylyl cyclase toxin [Sansalvadorimonas sp. 2012CJ34-2]